MGFIVKPKPAGIYGTLLHVYPQSFRDHYRTTMVQTFDDMLKNERTGFGRLRVWAITLLDLPFSAGKEHVTNGKGVIMNRNFRLLVGTALAAIVIVGIGSFWFGSLHARQNVGVEQVGVTQLADAMQQDDFYSTYGDAALLFTGKVAAVKRGTNATLVTFATGRPYSVTCQFPKTIAARMGQTLSVAAPGGSADRQTRGVLLHDCIVN
jgi:hypothetical protein